MWRKIIDDNRLQNDLFEIKLIFLWSKYVVIFSFCVDAMLFGMRRL